MPEYFFPPYPAEHFLRVPPPSSRPYTFRPISDGAIGAMSSGVQWATIGTLTTAEDTEYMQLAGAAAGYPGGYADLFSGEGVTGETNLFGNEGYDHYSMMGRTVDSTGSTYFQGVGSVGGVANPQDRLHTVGLSHERADLNTGNYYLIHNDGAGVATRIELTGLPRNTTDYARAIRIRKYADQAVIRVQIWRILTRTSLPQLILDTILSTNIPADATGLVIENYCESGSTAVSQIARYYDVNGWRRNLSSGLYLRGSEA